MMENPMNPKISFALFILISIFLPVSYACGEGTVITCYYDSWQGKVPGWRQLANQDGKIGDPAAYVELDYKNNSKHWEWGRNYFTDSTGKTRCGTKNNIVPGGEHYAISAYTFTKEPEGSVWMTNGNLQCKGRDGVILKVYLNSELKQEYTVKKNIKPFLFQLNLGTVHKGDTVYAAVRSQNDERSFYSMYYTFEELPQGSEPPEAVNIIRPGITQATPLVGPDGRPIPKYLARHKQQCDDALKNHPELFFIGDSITARWDQASLNEKFGKYKPAKFGYGGDWVQHVLWRIENGVLDKVKPEAVVLLIGTNNITHKFSAEEISEGIRKIVSVIKTKSPESKIIIMGIFPRGKSIHNNPYYETVKQVNLDIAGMADDKNIFYLDIGKQLVEPDGTITKEMMKDGLHIGSKGYAIWATALQPLLKKIFSTDKKN